MATLNNTMGKKIAKVRSKMDWSRARSGLGSSIFWLVELTIRRGNLRWTTLETWPSPSRNR
jgi:hypothetical protein